ncbi:MAG: CvpA family protein [Bradymonadaceae bacterium]
MFLDILAGTFLVLAGLFGWFSGAIVQCMRIVAVAVAILAADPAADFLRREIFDIHGVADPLVEVTVYVTALVGIFAVVSLIGWVVSSLARKASDRLTSLDRFGGVFLSLLKAVLVLYVGISLVMLLKPSLRELDEEDRLHVRDSRLLKLVERHNLVLPWRFPDLQRLHDAVKVDHYARKRGREALVRSHERASDVLRSKKFKGVTADGELVRAALEDDYPYTLSSRVVRDRLNDDAFVSRLRSVDWESLLRKVRNGKGAETAPERGR